MLKVDLNCTMQLFNRLLSFEGNLL